MRFFNTAGPVNCEEHYCLAPLERIDLAEVSGLIAQKKYFVLHAPRQVGKTSMLLALMEHLNQQGTVRCLYINVEVAQAAREDIEIAMRAMVGELAQRARATLQDSLPEQVSQQVLEAHGSLGALNALLTLWAESSSKPIVLLIDEIDSLIGDTLISVLRQLRAGYDKRPAAFPQSVVLCGVRDVRDYRIHSSRDKAIITGGSAFNIRAASLRLGNFSQAESERLCRQHTAETGQAFSPAALAELWRLTQGQPWLVNALAYETCFNMAEGRDRAQTITEEMILNAKERLIRRRETHLDQLADKLHEERVRRVIMPMLQGTELGGAVTDDDLQYTIDLGLVVRGAEGPQIANPIYREIIPRQLSDITQANLESLIKPSWYVSGDGLLQVDQLVAAFQQFFRENSAHWIERFQYKEAGPQLLLQAYLQRIVNGGGMIQREYGLGRGRTDLLILWRRADGMLQRAVIECKVQYGSRKATIEQGLRQTWRYMDTANAAEGHLILFNRSEQPWSRKIFQQVEEFQGRTIKIWGM